MAEDAHNTSTSDISDVLEPEERKEDAETAAARKELRHTAISDKDGNLKASDAATNKAAPSANTTADVDDPTERAETPDHDLSDAQDGHMKEKVLSPKKKRAHDQVDPSKEVDSQEPEKKRPRDLVEETTKTSDEATEPSGSAEDASKATITSNPKKESQPGTSASAFAQSGFGRLASSSASPFGALGAASAKTSIFGGTSSGSQSPFGASASATTTQPAAAPKLSFGNGSAGGSASPFGALNGQSSSFGSGFGSGFGSAFGAPKLKSFAKPGETFKSEKPAKPFGAPDSDVEEDNSDKDEDGEGDGEGNEGDEGEGEETTKEETKALSEEKKPKLQKVVVDSGEAGETTILSVRTKMYQMDKTEGWKEKGAGMLKINVPHSCVDFDENGIPKPGSFDASGLEDDEDEEGGEAKSAKVARLIMRQDQTGRLLLNSVILPALHFEERQSLKATCILFPSFDQDGKSMTVQVKMNNANARAFLDEVDLIKRELSSM